MSKIFIRAVPCYLSSTPTVSFLFGLARDEFLSTASSKLFQILGAAILPPLLYQYSNLPRYVKGFDIIPTLTLSIIYLEFISRNIAKSLAYSLACSNPSWPEVPKPPPIGSSIRIVFSFPFS